ncbi:MAG: hypothetical protein KDI34_12475 [Halioglobus sp.]|nr:hypothetical protein [Halioglobus sp.]
MDITAESGTGEVEVDPQLVHVKRLYMSGCEFAGRADGFSAGLAISIFQDAVEDLLRYLVGRLDGKISKVPNFAELMNAVENTGDDGNARKLGYRTRIENLNRARVSFKHDGVCPAASEALKFKLYALEFLVAGCSDFLCGLDFNSVSITSLVAYPEVKQELRGAEAALEANDPVAAAVHCSKSNGLIMLRLGEHLPRPSMVIPRGDTILAGAFPDLYQLRIFDEIYSYLERSAEFSAAAMLGVPIKQYTRVIAALPRADLLSDNSWGVVHTSQATLDRELAREAIDLFANMAIKAQEFLGEG